MKVFREKAGVLRVNGKDKQDFLQRVSTNDFRSFRDGRAQRTVFTDPKARIVDFPVVASLNDEYYIICSQGNEKNLEEFFNKYTITEDVKNSLSEVETLTIFTYVTEEFSFYHGAGKDDVWEIDGNIFIKDGYGFIKVIVLLNNPESEFIKTLMLKVRQIYDFDFELNAFECGYLYRHSELNEDVNPLECGLKDYISFTKGCYIGQEVISRLDVQDKVQNEVIKFSCRVEIKPGDKILVKGEEENTECGYITSVFEENDHYRGFGFIKKKFADEDAKFIFKGKKTGNINLIKFL